MRNITVGIGVLFACIGAVNAADRDLARVEAADHDPLFVDRPSIQRSGSTVRFNYVLDVRAAAERRDVPEGWKSNEIEATIDCAGNTVSIGRITARTGPRATGSVTGIYSPTAAERKPEKIVPGSTPAYLAAFVCAPSDRH